MAFYTYTVYPNLYLPGQFSYEYLTTTVSPVHTIKGSIVADKPVQADPTNFIAKLLPPFRGRQGF
jgi:hypothetical protein